jgi:hypothetical protein
MAQRTTNQEEICIFAGVQVFGQGNMKVADRPHDTGLVSTVFSQRDQGAFGPCGHHRFRIALPLGLKFFATF